jgi:hypothetical protein
VIFMWLESSATGGVTKKNGELPNQNIPKQYTRCSHEVHFYVEVGGWKIGLLGSRMVYRLLPLGPLRNDSDDSNQPKAQCWIDTILKILKSAASATGISYHVWLIYSVSGRELQVTKCQCKVWVGGLRVAKTANLPTMWATDIKTGYTDWFGWREHLQESVVFYFLPLMTELSVCLWSDKTCLTGPHCRPRPTRCLAERHLHGTCSCTSMKQHAPPQKKSIFLVIWHEHIHPSRPKYLLCLTLELQLQHRDVGGESRYNGNTLILVHTHFTYIILYSHSYKSEQLIPTKKWEPHHKSETGTTYHTPFPLILTPDRPWFRGFTHIQNCLGFYTTCYDTFIHLRDGSPCFTWNSSRVGRKAHGFPRKMMVDAQTFMCCLNHNVFPSYFTINAILVVWNVVDMFQPI